MSHRVNVTLPDEIYRALKEYADVIQTQPTTVVRDLLLELMPQLSKVTQAIKESEDSKRVALCNMQSVLIDTVSYGIAAVSEVQEEIKKL